MKYIVVLLSILLFTTIKISAQVSSEFHKLDMDIYKIDKKSDVCINCHLVDTDEKSLSGWPSLKNLAFDTIENFDDADGEPDAFSKACLMCHDGNEASMVLNIPMCRITCNTSVRMGGENHPLFVKYIHKEGLNRPSSMLVGVWKDATTVADLLRNEKIVCISCHIPHHTAKDGFVRTSIKSSNLCLGCHDK